MTKTFNIKQVSFNQSPGIKKVREQVFIEEQGVPDELEWDGEDDNAIHVIALDNKDDVIGTVRLLANGHICRMAVIQQWRKLGVGTALLKAILKIARQQNLDEVFLHAQTTAAGFYKRFGFTTRGDEFMEAGIPHILMKRKLDSSEELTG